jgi:TRAP-type C4-dicarboxylate transport system permease small subunit
MTPTPRFQELKARVDITLGWILSAMMGLAVANVVWQVFTRYVLGDPSQFTDELARYLLIWVGLLGAGYAAGKRMHLAIDLLPMKLTGRAHEALGLLIDLMIFLFALIVMVFGGARLVGLQLMLEQTSAALGVPLGYVYLALPVSGLLIMFYSTLYMLDRIRVLRGGEPALPLTEEPSAEAFAEEVQAAAGADVAGHPHDLAPAEPSATPSRHGRPDAAPRR